MAEATNPLYDTVYKQDYLQFFDNDTLNAKNVAEFLDFTRADVSKIADVSKASVRYDDKIPKEVFDHLMSIANICNLVAAFFSNEPHKIKLWLTTPNPQFGEISPRDMIRYGRYKKVLRFVRSAYEAQIAEEQA